MGQKSDLKKVIIIKKGAMWHVTREREDSGESGVFSNLELAFDYVRAIYNEDGVAIQELGEK